MSTAPTTVKPGARLPDRARGLGVTLAFATATISGLAIFVNGYAVRRFPDADTYTTAKNLIAAVLLGGLLLMATATRTGEGWTPPRTGSQRWGLITIGVIGGSVPFLLFFEGLSRATTTDAAFIHKTLVVWVALLAVLLLRERLSWQHLAAIGLVVVGQAMLTNDLWSIGAGSAELMILAATVLWSIEVVLAKRLLGSLSPLTVGFSRMALGFLVLIAWAALRGESGELTGLSGSQWGWAVLTGVILTGYVATWYAALARAGAIDVTAVLVFGAVVTAALNGAIRDVPLRPDLAGLAAITAGAALVAWSAARSRRLVPA